VAVGAGVSLFLVEAAFTFATVVLAFTDIPAGDAVRHSLTVIRSRWPSSAFYVLAAPVTVQLMVLALPADVVSFPVRVLTMVVTAVVRLLCVGAAVLFYADRYLTVEGEA
jgi:hypothetical protein